MCISVVLINAWVNAIGHLTALEYFCCLKFFADGSFSLALWEVLGELFPTTRPLAPQSAKKWHLPTHTSSPTDNVSHPTLSHKEAFEKTLIQARGIWLQQYSQDNFENKVSKALKSALHMLCTPIEFKDVRVSSIKAKYQLQRGSFQLGKIQLFFQSLPDRFCSSSSRFRRHYL